jgi:hypothetical protein
LVQAAAANIEGQLPLFSGQQSHALPSLYTKQPKTQEVQVLPFDKIVSGSDYGLKIDIEGAEACLVDYPSVIKNAAWIVGELHYSGDTRRDSLIDEYFEIVKSNFVVKKSRPVAYFVGNNVLVCESFKASRNE